MLLYYYNKSKCQCFFFFFCNLHLQEVSPCGKILKTINFLTWLKLVVGKYVCVVKGAGVEILSDNGTNTFSLACLTCIVGALLCRSDLGYRENTPCFACLAWSPTSSHISVVLLL